MLHPIRKETRLDYYGVPYEATITSKKEKTKAELWAEYKAIEKHEVDLNGHLPINEKAINDYHNRLLEP